MQLQGNGHERAVGAQGFAAWLAFGMDAGRVLDLGARLCARYRKEGLDVISIDAQEAIADPGSITARTMGATLFSPATAIRIRGADDKLAKALEPILDAGIGDARLIVEADDLKKESKLRKLFEGRADCASMACRAPEKEQLMARAKAKLSFMEVKLGPGAAEAIAELSAPDTGIIDRDCERLAAFAGRDVLTREDVVNAMSDDAEAGLDDLTLAMAGGDARRAMDAHARLLAVKTEPILIVRSTIRHMQRIHACAVEIAAGANPRSAMQSLRPPVFWSMADRFERQVSLWTPQRAEGAVARLIEAERQAKSGFPMEAAIGQAILDVTLATRKGGRQ